MKTKPIQRMLSLISALALLLTVFAVPAFAAGPSATAALDAADRLVKAGTTNTFDVTVTNTEPAPNILGQGGGSSINAVIITVSSAFADLGVDLVDVPEGWDAPSEVRPNQILFEATDAGLAPGESVVFHVNSSIVSPTADKLGTFQVQVSGDGGQNSGPVTNAGSADLQSVLRILDITKIEIVEPLAGQLTVTDGQANTVVDVTVTNAGSAAKTVLPTLTETGSANFTILEQPAAAPVPAGGSETFSYPVSFSRSGSADVETLTFDAVIDSADADAEIADELRPTVSVQRAVELAYLADTLSPRDVAAAKRDINVGIGKAGVPAADLTITSTFTQDDQTIAPPAPVTTSVAEGSDALNPVTFLAVPFDTPGLSDGEFDVNLAASGTDANGAPISIPSIPVGDTIYLDLVAPILNITGFTPPASRVEGMADAATEGEAFALTGNVQDRGQPCPDCTVTGLLKIGTQPAYEVTVPVDGAGNFSQDVVVQNAPADTQDSSAVLTLTAIDATGEDTVDHRASAVATGTVDTLAPQMKNTAPLTGGLAEIIGAEEDTSRIDVLFPEGIGAQMDTSPANWSVQMGDGGSDNLVTDATIQTAEAVTSGQVGGITYTAGQTLWFVQLTLNTELSGNDEGTVTYEPDSRLGIGLGEATGLTRVFDRVDLGLGFGVKELIDNIAPELPIVGLVAGKLQQTDDDGASKFFTNSGETDVTLNELEPGSWVELWLRETDGSEQRLATSGIVSTNSHTFEGVTLAGLDREFEFFGIAFDGGTKSSKGDGSLTVLDRVAPELVSATFSDASDSLRVVTDEGLVGRDRTFDWYAEATSNAGDPEVIFIDSVAKAAETPAYDLRQRDLGLDTSTWDPSAGGNATIETLVYDYLGPDEEQYADRAGNLFERLEPLPISGAPDNSGSSTETGTVILNPTPTNEQRDEEEDASVVGGVVERLLGGG